MHVKSPEAIITRRREVTVPRATRCFRCVAPGQPSPAAPSRAREPRPPWGPRGAGRRLGYAPPAPWVGWRGRPRRRRPRIAVPPPLVATPHPVPRLRRRRRSHGGPWLKGGFFCTTITLGKRREVCARVVVCSVFLFFSRCAASVILLPRWCVCTSEQPAQCLLWLPCVKEWRNDRKSGEDAGLREG